MVSIPEPHHDRLTSPAVHGSTFNARLRRWPELLSPGVPGGGSIHEGGAHEGAGGPGPGPVHHAETG